jgi:hypothetical protein
MWVCFMRIHIPERVDILRDDAQTDCLQGRGHNSGVIYCQIWMDQQHIVVIREEAIARDGRRQKPQQPEILHL